MHSFKISSSVFKVTDVSLPRLIQMSGLIGPGLVVKTVYMNTTRRPISKNRVLHIQVNFISFIGLTSISSVKTKQRIFHYQIN